MMDPTVKALSKLTAKKARLLATCADLQTQVLQIDQEIAALAKKLLPHPTHDPYGNVYEQAVQMYPIEPSSVLGLKAK